jgi:hypothetical protein
MGVLQAAAPAISVVQFQDPNPHCALLCCIATVMHLGTHPPRCAAYNSMMPWPTTAAEAVSVFGIVCEGSRIEVRARIECAMLCCCPHLHVPPAHVPAAQARIECTRPGLIASLHMQSAADAVSHGNALPSWLLALLAGKHPIVQNITWCCCNYSTCPSCLAKVKHVARNNLCQLVSTLLCCVLLLLLLLLQLHLLMLSYSIRPSCLAGITHGYGIQPPRAPVACPMYRLSCCYQGGCQLPPAGSQTVQPEQHPAAGGCGTKHGQRAQLW